jgi:hypothetical protein
LTAAIATFALNAAECVRRVLFVIFKVPLSALSPAQAPSVPLIRLSEFARPPLYSRLEEVELAALIGLQNVLDVKQALTTRWHSPAYRCERVGFRSRCSDGAN